MATPGGQVVPPRVTPPDANTESLASHTPARARIDRARLIAGALGAFTAGIVGLVATATGALFDVAPGLRPDPGTQIAASMQVMSIDRGVTLGDYLRRIHWSKRVDESIANDVGAVAYVRMSVHGRKGHHLTLAEAIYRVPERQRLDDRGNPASQYFHDDTTNDQWIAEVFIPPMLSSAHFFARFELWEEHDLLAYADSRVLQGSVKRLE